MTDRAEQVEQRNPVTANDNLDSVRNYSACDLRTALASSESRDACGLEGFPAGGSLLDSLNSGGKEGQHDFGSKQGDQAFGSAERNENRTTEHRPKEKEVDPQAAMAADILDAGNPFKNERDRQTMSDLHLALMTGDTQALSATIGQLKNDPNRLQYLMQALNQNLIDSGSGMRVNVNKSGDRVTFAGLGENAVQISVDGRASVRQVTGTDGGSFQYGAQVYNASPEGTLKAMAEGSRLSVIFNSFINPRR